MVPRLVLASASPRRREILAAAGLEFEVVVADVDELHDGDPVELVVENALRKARAVAALRPDDLVLGADTDVALDGRVLGKAADEPGARERLTALRGREHDVLGGVAMCEPGGGEWTGFARTQVRFKPFADETLDLYLRSGEWRDRAGAYAIQGLGSILIDSISGDFLNVVGLPSPTLQMLLAELGDSL